MTPWALAGLKRLAMWTPIMALITLTLRLMARIRLPAGLEDQPDPVEAVLALRLKPARKGLPRRIWRRAGLIAEDYLNAVTVDPGPAIGALLLGVARVPDGARLQLAAASLIARHRHEPCEAIFAGIDARFGSDAEARRAMFRIQTRRLGRRAAIETLTTVSDEETPIQAAIRAQCLEDLGQYEAADQLWATISQAGDPAIIDRHARSLAARGYPGKALKLLATLPETRKTSRQTEALQSLMQSHGINLDDESYLPSILADRMLDDIARQRSKMKANGSPLRKIILINASLGLGGAERQCVNTAIELARNYPERHIEVWVRSLDGRKSHSLLLPELQAANVTVRAIDRFSTSRREFSRHRPNVNFAALNPHVPYLGLTAIRLFNGLRQHRPDLVHLWQDATISLMGLSVMWADVPHVVLSFRSLPPPMKNADRPYFKTLLSGLARLPGVSVSANTEAGRQAYAAWLDLDPGPIHVIPNALVNIGRLPASQTEIARLEGAIRTLSNPSTVVMGLMRLDENKRPDDWVRVAAKVAQRHTDVGFILLGDGPLRSRVEHLAKTLMPDGRLVIAGATRRPEVWLSRARILMHLSRIEGLPNALIEAQASGCAILSTDAGGAREAFLPDRTGLLVENGDDLDLDIVADRLSSLVVDTDTRMAMAQTARDFARDHFSPESMLAATLSLYEAA